MCVTLGVLIDISTSRTALRGFDTVSALRNFTKAFCFALLCFVLFVNVLHQSTVKWSFQITTSEQVADTELYMESRDHQMKVPMPTTCSPAHTG